MMILPHTSTSYLDNILCHCLYYCLHNFEELPLLLFIRSSIFAIGYFVLTISYGTLSLFLWLSPPLARHKVVCTWTSAVISWLRISCNIRYQVIGRENLTSEVQPTVILAKHQSAWETLFLQGLFWPASTVLKKELLRIPFFGWGLIAMNPIAINRSNPREALRQVKSKGIARIEGGLNIILFPEGTRTAPGEKGTYARSGADIAKSAEVDILPVAVNSGHCWPSNSFMKYPGLVTVSIGPKIITAEKTNKKVMQEVETWIENEMQSIDAQ